MVSAFGSVEGAVDIPLVDLGGRQISDEVEPNLFGYGYAALRDIARYSIDAADTQQNQTQEQRDQQWGHVSEQPSHRSSMKRDKTPPWLIETATTSSVVRPAAFSTV